MIAKHAKAALIILALMALIQGNACAISEGGAIFLLIRPGARPSGMGSAFAAIADDATATYFNPAGLGYLMPDEVRSFKTEDVRDWPGLVSSLQDKDVYYLFQTHDIKYPAELILDARQSPYLSVSDIKDWKRLAEYLSDTSAAGSFWKTVRNSSDSASAAALNKMKEGKELLTSEKWDVLFPINRIMKGKDIYRQAVNDKLALQARADSLVRRVRSSSMVTAVEPDDILDPAGLAGKITGRKDPLSSYLFGKLPAKARAAFKDTSEPDSLKKILSTELGKIITGKKLYRPDRFSGIVISPSLLAEAVMPLRGDSLTSLNVRLLEEAYPSEILVYSNFRKLSQTELVDLNRSLVESYLPGVLAEIGQRQKDDPLSAYIADQIAQPVWETLNNYDGTVPADSAMAELAIEFMNAVVNGYQEGTDGAQGSLDVLKRNRAALDARFSGLIIPSSEKKAASVKMHIRGLLADECASVCDKYYTQKIIDPADKISILAGMNMLLADKRLYDARYFQEKDLDRETFAVIQQGIDNLTEEELTGVNRRLLEIALHPFLNKKVEAIPHYATMMHSPWLSQIWSDVGDMYYEFIAYAQPVKDWGVFGGNVIFLSEGSNVHIDEQNRVLGTFSSFEFSPTLSYANKIYNNLAGGINFKIIHSHLAPFGAPGQQGKGIATTWAVDLGLLLHGPVKGLALGVNVQNIGPKLTYIDAQQADPLSRNMRLGTAYDILNGKLSKLTMAWDATKTIVKLPPDRPWKEELKDVVHHIGLEYWYQGPASLALRTGYVLDEIGSIKGATYGAGVGYRKIQFDFAMEPGGDLQNYNRKFSLSAVF